MEDENAFLFYLTQLERDANDPAVRLHRNRHRHHPGRVAAEEPSFFSFSRLVELFTFAYLPLVLSRVLHSLLSASVFSDNIVSELHDYIYNSSYAPNSLLLKFNNVVFEQASDFIDIQKFESTLRAMTVILYVLYSCSMSIYITLTLMFFVLALSMTTVRRWGSELPKYLYNVFRGRNGVI